MTAITHIAADLQALSEVVADQYINIAQQAIATNGKFYVALAGGNTPQRLYETLASPAFARRIAWDHVHVYFGDERCVPPDDPASNYRMAWESLLSRVPIPSGQVHRIAGELSPEEAAEDYEGQLAQLPSTLEGLPRFDLVLLGLGRDGHVASLFPASDALEERRRFAVAVRYERREPAAADRAVWRVTLTLPVINAARHLFMLVAGNDKAQIVNKVFAPPIPVPPLPAQMLRPNGDIDWYLDAAAAMQMPYVPLRASE
jgi:6-phosphogluconolactonase